MSDAPGLEPYSRKWIEKHFTNVPGQLQRAVRDICSAYFLDGREANYVSGFIELSLIGQLHERHRLNSGRVVDPIEIRVTRGGFSYLGVEEERPNDPPVLYRFEDIKEVLT